MERLKQKSVVAQCQRQLRGREVGGQSRGIWLLEVIRMGRVNLRGATQEETLLLLCCQCASLRVTPQVTPMLLGLTVE